MWNETAGLVSATSRLTMSAGEKRPSLRVGELSQRRQRPWDPPLLLPTPLLLLTTPQVAPMLWLVPPSWPRCPWDVSSFLLKLGDLAKRSPDSVPTTATCGLQGRGAPFLPNASLERALHDVDGKSSILGKITYNFHPRLIVTATTRKNLLQKPCETPNQTLPA